MNLHTIVMLGYEMLIFLKNHSWGAQFPDNPPERGELLPFLIKNTCFTHKGISFFPFFKSVCTPIFKNINQEYFLGWLTRILQLNYSNLQLTPA